MVMVCWCAMLLLRLLCRCTMVVPLVAVVVYRCSMLVVLAAGLTPFHFSAQLEPSLSPEPPIVTRMKC